jgi:hypothetical protein
MPPTLSAEDKSKLVVQRKVKRPSELSNANFTPEQKPPIQMPPIDEPVERESDLVTALDSITPADFDALAFAEEPVTILIHRSVEKFSPPTTDYIAINGVGAEMLYKNGWVRMGYLPRGRSIITKRKYVEVLARAKQDSVTTNVIERDGEDPLNFVERVTTSTMSFTIMEDKNPLGAAWLEQLVRQRS